MNLKLTIPKNTRLKFTKDTVWKKRLRYAMIDLVKLIRWSHRRGINLNDEAMNDLGYGRRYNSWKRRYLRKDKAGRLLVTLDLNGRFHQNLTPVQGKAVKNKLMKSFSMFIRTVKPVKIEEYNGRSARSYKEAVKLYEDFTLSRDNYLLLYDAFWRGAKSPSFLVKLT